MSPIVNILMKRKSIVLLFYYSIILLFSSVVADKSTDVATKCIELNTYNVTSTIISQQLMSVSIR